MTIPKHLWMVRAGDNNELANQVEDKQAVAIGWAEMGDLSGLKTRAQFKERYRQVYPDDSLYRTAVNAGQIYRFVCEIEAGNYVLTYDKANREIIIGQAEGSYEYKPTLFGEAYPHVRKVNWLKRVSRDSFSMPARNSLGSVLTVFQVDDHLQELHRLATATKEAAPPPQAEQEAPPFYEEVKAKADELISDLISRLDPYDFQNLVAAALRAMGFRAVSVPPGPDRGIDIIAHPDAFGFDRPHIKVQVKHRKGSTGGPEMRSFLGTLRSGDSGLYVSTGGFTKDAETDASHSSHPVKLLDRDGFIQLLLEHYEALEPEYQAQVPLRRIWLPTE